MKWRTSAIYLLVLLLMGGYYYYYEVVQKERREASEKEARRVLSFDAKAAEEIEIRSRQSAPVRLVKKEKWLIAEPISSEVDQMAFESFMSALEDAEQERKIDQPPANLEEFGLNDPLLTIRILAGERRLELQAGSWNPTNTARYARTGAEGAPIFLITRASYEALNKGLKDFRKKELFTWMPDQISALNVNWNSGEKVRIERQPGTREWKAADLPDLKIKARKVEKVLDQLHWLRAVDFPEANSMPESVAVNVTMRLKDGQTADLKVASPDPATKQAIASCSGMQGPVKIASQILDTLPKSASLLADRSLMAFDPADVREVSWKIEEGGGNAVWIDANTWGKKEGDSSDSSPIPFSDPWSVKLFLTDLDNIEYIDVVEPGPNPPEKPVNFVRFRSVEQKEGALSWNSPPPESGGPVTVRLEKDGRTRTVTLQNDSFQRIKTSLLEMTQAMKEK